MINVAEKLIVHQQVLKACSLCPDMVGPVVTGQPVESRIVLVGQAPGAKEGEFARPFAWTAGKTLFKWFNEIGLDEQFFRSRVYMAAVCRCFPGKNPKGGDRVPTEREIQNCSVWMESELDLLEPDLLIPVGKLAIKQLLTFDKLKQVVGTKQRIIRNNRDIDIIPLPHPSGASTWHRMEPGKSLLKKALRLIQEHPAWLDVCGN